LRITTLSSDDAKELLDILPKLQYNLTTLEVIFQSEDLPFYAQNLREVILCRPILPALKRCVLTFYDNFTEKIIKNSTTNIKYLKFGSILIQDFNYFNVYQK
ncbi:unnamed protein product, partial [Didymodactylos carnosus]